MDRQSKTLRRLGVTGLGAITLLSAPSFGVLAASAAPATITIVSQTTGSASTRNDGTNTTARITANVAPATGSDAAVSSVRFTYQSTAAGSAPVVIATDTTAPYSAEFSAPAGTYRLTAEALDAGNNVVSRSDKTAVLVGDLPAVHVSSPAEGTQIGYFNGRIPVSGTRSADLPPLSLTASCRNPLDGGVSAPGAATTVPAGNPAATPTPTNTFNTTVALPATCQLPGTNGNTGTTQPDVFITAQAGDTSGTTTSSDEVTQATLYAQTLTSFTVAPATATKPAGGAGQQYVATASDQNGKPIVGLAVAVTTTSGGGTATPATGVTDNAGTFTFTGNDAAAETTTFRVETRSNGTSFNGAADFFRTVQLVTYTPVATTLTLSAVPMQTVYADSQYTATSPTVLLCIVDQNGNPFAGAAPAGLMATVSRNGATPTNVTPTADATRQGCFDVPHAAAPAGSTGSDSFVGYIERDGTPGPTSGDLIATPNPLTLNFAPSVANFLPCTSSTACNSQAQVGKVATYTFREGLGSSTIPNRKVNFTINNGAFFPTVQPAGTTRGATPGTASCVTGADGTCQVNVTDDTVGTATLTGTDAGGSTDGTPANGLTATVTIAFRTAAVALNGLVRTGMTVLAPEGDGAQQPTPGRPTRYTYRLTDSNLSNSADSTSGQPVANVPVTFTTSAGFFTNDEKTPGSYSTLTFDPAAVAGALAGSLVNNGTSVTLQSDNNGVVSFVVADGRDAGFDDDGLVLASFTAVSNGTTRQTSGAFNPAATTGQFTFTTRANPLNLSATAPLTFREVNGLPLSGNVPTVQTRDFVVEVRDQFGNLVVLPTPAVNLTLTGPGSLGRVGGTATAPTFTTATNTAGSYTSAPDVIESRSDTAGTQTVTATLANATQTTFQAVPNSNPAAFTVVQTNATTAKTVNFSLSYYVQDPSKFGFLFTTTPAGTVPVNTAVTVSATVTDQFQNPVPGLVVQFIRSGPGSQSSGTDPVVRVTNQAGTAGYSFSSTDAGQATVTVIISDASGNELRRGVQTVTFTAGNNGPAKPSSLGASGPANAAVISGVADQNTTETISVVDSAGKSVSGAATTDSTGHFSATLDLSGLADGTLTISVLSKNTAGTPSLVATFQATKVTGQPITPITPAAGSTFHSVAPARVLDTRTSTPIGDAATRSVQITGLGGVPAGATGVVFNVTAVNPSKSTYLTVFNGASRPGNSTVNAPVGRTVANLAESALNSDGTVSVFNFAGNTDVLLDVTGYYTADTTGTSYFTVAPKRVLDTRSPTGGTGSPLTPGETRALRVLGMAGVPTTGVTAIVANVTAVNPTGAGYLSVYPSPKSSTSPGTSTVNFPARTNTANLAVIPVGADGNVEIFNSAGNTEVLVDVVGFYGTLGTSGLFVGITPTRVLDTRRPAQAPAIQPATARTVAVAGQGLTAPSGAKAAIVNLTAILPTGKGYLEAYSGGQRPYPVSSVNFVPRLTVANLAVVPLASDGTFQLFNSSGITDVAVDVVGYFTG